MSATSSAVIVATARTPIGRAYKGSLVEARPDDLSALVIQSALAKLPGLDPRLVEDVYWGCAQPAGEQGYNIARVAGLLAGLPNVPGATVNRYCSSSLQAIRMAAHAIAAGEGDVFISGGVECVSRFAKGKADGMEGTLNSSFAEAQARSRRYAQGEEWKPAEGLPDVYVSMGQTAENVARSCKVSRREQDEFAALSQQRAVAAQQSGFFAEEITKVTLANGTVVDRDDCPRAGTTVEGLAGLKPVFFESGTVTAGNACPLNDGAAAVVVMSAARAKALAIKPIARVVASGVSALDPEIMGLGPVAASKQALARAGLSIKDIDLVEINEAFAAQVIPSAKQLEVPLEKLNVSGGAIALGHPFGMTGARIMTTLLHNLQVRGGRYGLETMCVGGGQGMAMIVELLP
jgi:acetyl-CoA C-acetyltransferase